jgi:hypothetical protein
MMYLVKVSIPEEILSKNNTAALGFRAALSIGGSGGSEDAMVMEKMSLQDWLWRRQACAIGCENLTALSGIQSQFLNLLLTLFLLNFQGY